MYVLNVFTYLIQIECNCDEGYMYMIKKLLLLLFVKIKGKNVMKNIVCLKSKIYFHEILHKDN